MVWYWPEVAIHSDTSLTSAIHDKAVIRQTRISSEWITALGQYQTIAEYVNPKTLHGVAMCDFFVSLLGNRRIYNMWRNLDRQRFTKI
jgi:hypothetical protein